MPCWRWAFTAGSTRAENSSSSPQFTAASAASAQADTATLSHDGGGEHPGPQQTDPTASPTATPQPLAALREACAVNPADVIIRGRFAPFDVYWDPETRTLNNNPCPPAVTHVVTNPPAPPPPALPPSPVVTTSRAPSNIDIRHTVIHIPDSEKFTLVETASPQSAQEGYIGVNTNSPLWEFYNPSEDNPSGLERVAWVLREWEAERPSHEEVLHLGFSAGLLKEAQWHEEIQYGFEVIREPGVRPADRGAMFASDNP